MVLSSPLVRGFVLQCSWMPDLIVWIAGWEMAFTDEGRTYFLDHVHRTTHWEREFEDCFRDYCMCP
jgi:hypothetical protein